MITGQESLKLVREQVEMVEFFLKKLFQEDVIEYDGFDFIYGTEGKFFLLIYNKFGNVIAKFLINMDGEVGAMVVENVKYYPMLYYDNEALGYIESLSLGDVLEIIQNAVIGLLVEG